MLKEPNLCFNFAATAFNNLALKIIIDLSFKSLFAFLILLATSNNIVAQKGLFVSGHYIHGVYTNDIKIQYRPTTNHQALGFGAMLHYSQPFFDDVIAVQLGAGFKQLFASGNFDHDSFKGKTSKLALKMGLAHLFFEKMECAAGIQLENNLDFDDFRIKNNDNFRFGLDLKVAYELWPNVSVQAGYYRAFSPNEDVYLVLNPLDQFNVGIQYKIPWL